jgi:P27 family predicted phage terminase small subunit
MKPRQSVATTKKHLTKLEQKNISKQEEKLKLARDDLCVPSWLEEDSIAKEEFIRVAVETETIGILDNLDLSILAIYCKAYSSYVECTAKIDKYGHVIQSKSGKTLSPYVTAQSKYAEQIFKCSSKLGLATTDRLKLVVPEGVQGEVNKFLKYVT